MIKSNYKFQGTGLNTKERSWAKKRFKNYLINYPYVNNLSDLELLEELVFREAIQERYKVKIGILADNKKLKNEGLIPKHILKSLDDNLQQVLTLKEKLGLFDEKKEKSFFDHFKTLSNKFKQWRKNNWSEREVVCPFCSKIFFLKIRTDKYESIKSPFFKNRTIANRPLFELVKGGKITKEEAAEVLGVSSDYIDWLKEKFYNSSEKIS